MKWHRYRYHYGCAVEMTQIVSILYVIITDLSVSSFSLESRTRRPTDDNWRTVTPRYDAGTTVRIVYVWHWSDDVYGHRTMHIWVAGCEIFLHAVLFFSPIASLSSSPMTHIVSRTTYAGWPKNGTVFVERLNFVKYQPIFKILSLSESGENL